MSRPVIITCAITGTRPQKTDNPAVPISVTEQIESTHAAFEAGAAAVHIHVRDDEGQPSSDPERFAAAVEGIRHHCPGMVIEVSTGGMYRPLQERATALAVGADMASLCPGSINFPNGTYRNPPDTVRALAERMWALGIRPTIEIFDLSMLYAARALVDQGLVREPLNLLFVVGLATGLPARRSVVDFMIAEMKDILPSATWTASGLGRTQSLAQDWSLYRGGHLRTGLEDNIRLTRTELAQSNAQLVERAAQLCIEYGVRPATPAEARAILELPAAH